MIETAGKWLASPWRLIRGAALFALAAFAAWSASRYIRRRGESHRRRQAATTGKKAARHNQQATQLDQAAAKAKNKAEKRIKKLRESGHTSMAQAVESLNAL